MTTVLTQCTACGKLYGGTGRDALCRQCVESRRTGRSSRDLLCTQCGQRPALPGAGVCPRCQTGLILEFRDSAFDLRREAEPRRKSVATFQGLRTALDEKRQRAGFRRLNPALPSIKGWR